MSKFSIPVVTTDILILGAGGAGLCAALHAADSGKKIKILLVAKAIVGKGGCSRMVQGGYNVVLNPADSFDKHFQDTLKVDRQGANADDAIPVFDFSRKIVPSGIFENHRRNFNVLGEDVIGEMMGM